MTRLAERPNLSQDVEETLREMIIAGTLMGGERLNEVALAERLGVSRTPLREALSRLAAEGWTVSIPRRGFFVAELFAEEVRQLYPIRQLLDPEALRLAGVPDAAHLDRLARLNERIAKTRKPATIIDLDDRWHLELVAACPNRILLDLIRQFMLKTRRYELAYMAERQNVDAATAEHEAILALLADGDLDAACDRLRANMSSAVDPLVAWLEPTQSEFPKDPTSETES